MMQVEPKNNYNVLGRLGPTQPRPEYRPRGTLDGTGAKAEGGGAEREAKAGQRPAAAAAATSDGRLNLAAAKTLCQATAEAIGSLDPRACNQGPHVLVGRGAGLMYPRYV
jgi:hypothetical protein